ncbi:cytochrome b [Gallibacterium trehalosifermentans]|uniref:Cytochrome b n=1 Tax=Gallibacterium trehalosifermentans TaxID=516935 RepID=A0ABV6H141_9PAST
MSATHYPKVQIFLHWFSLLLIGLTYINIHLRDLDLTFDWYDLMMDTHYTLGILVFFTVFIRLIVRHLYIKRTPEILPTPPVWQNKLAHYAHLALYLLFILIPIFGVLTVLNKGFNVTFFGYTIFTGFSANPETAHSIKEIHETLTNIGLIFIGLHALAALYHHYIVKDNTLLRMMPNRTRSGE